MKPKNLPAKKNIIHYFSFITLTLLLSNASFAMDSEVFVIHGDVGSYVGFDLQAETNHTCDHRTPTWRRISGLPADIYQSSCVIYGTPQVAGTYRLEFPIIDGVWLADLVITGDEDGNEDGNVPTAAEISAARFLARSTFGATSSEIRALAAGGNQFEQWIDAQFELPITSRLNALQNSPIMECGSSEISADEMASVWWDAVLNGDDQLRQRVAFALSEILVISKQGDLDKQAIGLTDYYDVLTRNAFGNYRDLLREVTLHPTMGIYLTMFGNTPANGAVRPDENYARELLQLFAIGINQLNLDGSVQLDPLTGNQIPTYTQSTVENFAKVFTGWNLVGVDSYNFALQGVLGRADMTLPMIVTAAYHDTTEKILLGDAVLPAGQTAEEDLDFAINNVFQHPNVGPFIGKQLIQRLVTSNPSNDYIQHVAQAFNDNGAGVRGDLRAVVRAVLLDPEARDVHPPSDNFGKFREPLLRLSHLRRAFGVVPVTVNEGCGDFDLYRLSWASLGSTSSIQTGIGQNILHSPSVFNFFLPNYSPPGIVTESNLVGPEFQIVTENTMANLANVIGDEIQNSGRNNNIITAIITNTEVELANDSNVLLDHLNLLLLSGSMTSDLRTHLLSLLGNSVYPDNELGRSNKVKDVMTLIVSSPDYLIQQ